MSRISAALSLAALLVLLGNAKDKEKVALPAYVLQAQTIAVVISPQAGEPLADPAANRKAQEDVEKALLKWGRFRIVPDSVTADLVIAVRKGTKQAVSPTVRGGPVDTRPVTVEPIDGNIRVGVQQGRPPDVTQGGNQSPPNSKPSVGTDVGPAEDTFEVYRGGAEFPLDSPPVWRYISKDALGTPSVQAFDQFRKAIEEAEKAEAQRQQKKKP